MPDYLFTAPNGKSIKVTGDTLPSETELDSIFKAAGVDTGSGDTFSRRGGASSQAMISAPDATAEPDVVTLGELRDNPKAAMQRIGAILGKDATDPKLWLTLAASYLAPKVFSAVAPTLGKAAAGARGLATTGMVKDLATVGLGEGRVGAGLRIAGRVADAVRPAAVAAPEPAVSSPQPVQATGTSMTPALMPTLRAAPAPEPVQPSPAPEPAIPGARGKSPQQIANETALAARRAKYQDAQQAQPEAPVTDPAAELARRLGTPSDAERTFPANKSGLPARAPTAVKARGGAKIADLADMPASTTAPEPAPTGPSAEAIARQAAATKQKFTGKISDLADVPEATRKYGVQQDVKNMSPEVDYALKWIEADMENMPFNKRTVIPHPEPGHGGDQIGIGGSAGAKIYRSIVGQEGHEISTASRGDVIQAIKNLRAGKVTPVGELVLGVAKDLSNMSMAKLQKIMETGPPTP
jgi:hypothetical protein